MSTGENYIPTERRPIASRNQRIWIKAAGWLGAHHVSPNAISIAGMVAALLAGAALAGTSATDGVAKRALWLLAAVCVQLRLLANMLDGMVALESHRASPVGELYNEVPDRASDVFVLLGLGFAAGGEPALGSIAAILAVFTAYVRAAAKNAGAGQDYRGPMAKQHRMFVVTSACLYMSFSPAAWQPLWHGRWGIAALALAFIGLGCIITAWRRLSRAARFLKGGTA